MDFLFVGASFSIKFPESGCRADQVFPSSSLKSIPFKPPQFSNTWLLHCGAEALQPPSVLDPKERLPLLKHCRHALVAANKVFLICFHTLLSFPLQHCKSFLFDPLVELHTVIVR